jgi:homoserine dehydrogenase
VSANKQIVARDGPPLARLAARQGRQFRYEAAVGGAMPILAALDALGGDRVHAVDAVLNGTTNAVLSRMDEEGCSFESALAEARARGWAESDATLDVDGGDARAKLAVLCAAAFHLHVRPHEIEARSSRNVDVSALAGARRRGGTIRQLACAGYDRRSRTLTAWVAPAIVPRDSVLGRITGPRNAAIVRGEFAGDIELTGLGAGGDATAVAIIGDLLAIARDRAAPVAAPLLERPAAIAGIPRHGNGQRIERSRFALCAEAV